MEVTRQIIQHNSCTIAIIVSAEISAVCFGTAKGTIVGADATHFSRNFRR